MNCSNDGDSKIYVCYCLIYYGLCMFISIQARFSDGSALDFDVHFSAEKKWLAKMVVKLLGFCGETKIMEAKFHTCHNTKCLHYLTDPLLS